MAKVLLILSLFHLFALSAISQSHVADDSVSEIIVTAKNDSLFLSKAYKEYLLQNSLRIDKVYKSVRGQKLSFLGTPDSIVLGRICQSILSKFPSVEICELNKKVQPQDEIHCQEVSHHLYENFTGFIKDANQITSVFFRADSCTLINRNHINNRPNFPQGLSSLWAQEYVGADLLRDLILENDISTKQAKSIIEVLDTNDNDHGALVSNIIGGKFESGIIPMKKSIKHFNLKKVSDYIEGYEHFLERCLRKDNCPRYINNSMNWRNSRIVERSVENIVNSTGAVIFASAGNASKKVPAVRENASKKDHVLLVGSVDSKGLFSDFSNFSEELAIVAPSDYQILSFNDKGKPTSFGGTSGATPLVTGTIGSFDLISGVSVDTITAKKILEKTAIKYSDDPEGRFLGKGMLNAYKVGAVALRVKASCPKGAQQKVCAIDLLNNDDVYDFSDEVNEDEILKEIGAQFPTCGSAKKSQQEVLSENCSKKSDSLARLRKGVLLSNSKELWSALGCVYESRGYSINANFYKRLASGTRTNSQDSIDNLGRGELLERFFQTSDLAKKFMLLKNSPWIFDYAPANYKDDERIVLMAAKENHLILNRISDRLKNDKVFVSKLIDEGIPALFFVSKELRQDKAFISEMRAKSPIQTSN